MADLDRKIEFHLGCRNLIITYFCFPIRDRPYKKHRPYLLFSFFFQFCQNIFPCKIGLDPPIRSAKSVAFSINIDWSPINTHCTRVVRKLLRQSLFCQKNWTSVKTTYTIIKCYIYVVPGLIYLTASFDGYDPVFSLRLIPPLPRSTSHYVDVHCTVSLIYYLLNEQAAINSFGSKIHLYQ